MAKIIGFREDFKRESVILDECRCYEIRNLRGLTKRCSSRGIPYYNMVQDGPDWSIGYQHKLRFFLDDGKTVDFVEDNDGAVQFLKDYIANGGEVVEQQPVFIQDDDETVVI